MIHMATERTEAPFLADERATLTGFLDFQRATLAIKCEGLTEDQLRERAFRRPPVPARPGQAHGRGRAQLVQAGAGRRADVADLRPGHGLGASFRDVDTPTSRRRSRPGRPSDHARELVAAAPSLDVQGFRRSGYVSLRWTLTHMIEECARHNGHADFLRERLDGATGQ